MKEAYHLKSCDHLCFFLWFEKLSTFFLEWIPCLSKYFWQPSLFCTIKWITDARENFCLKSIKRKRMTFRKSKAIMLKIVCNLQKTNVECFLLLDSKPGIGLDFLLIQHFVWVSYPWSIFPLVYIHFNCSVTWDLIRTHFLPLQNWWTTFNY